ncbi:MAG: hypothetical protein HQK84_07055 [Nitrospinae bacterium]|nr:hypothetical protein [Nitrospinota bacterium]
MSNIEEDIHPCEICFNEIYSNIEASCSSCNACFHPWCVEDVCPQCNAKIDIKEKWEHKENLMHNLNEVELTIDEIERNISELSGRLTDLKVSIQTFQKRVLLRRKE